jgi:TPR repeat protein
MADVLFKKITARRSSSRPVTCQRPPKLEKNKISDRRNDFDSGRMSRDCCGPIALAITANSRPGTFRERTFAHSVLSQMRKSSHLISAKALLVTVVLLCPNPDLFASNDTQPGLVTSEQLKRLIARGESGDPETQLALGYIYAAGKDVVQDDHEAVRWFRLAAAQRHPRAEYMMGMSYLYGMGVEKDLVESVKWFLRSSDHGDLNAKVRLGRMYCLGIGVPRDLAVGLELIRFAADRDNSEAQNQLGLLYQTGVGVSEDVAVAVKWFRLAAGQGNSEAQTNLGSFYYSLQDAPGSDAEAVKWFRLAAFAGNPRAQNNLGGAYADGRGVPKDFLEAAKWFRAAAAQGNRFSQLNLGLFYRDGKGVLQNFEEAARLFRLAADQGEPESQWQLGRMYALGRGVPRDVVQSEKWFDLAAESGSTAYLKRRGDELMTGSGEGGVRVPEMAIDYYRRAGLAGNTAAQLRLAKAYAQGEVVTQDETLAYAWYSLVAAKGNADGIEGRDAIDRKLTQEQRKQFALRVATLRDEQRRWRLQQE